MTTTLGASQGADCPLPPNDFADAAIPVYELNLSVTDLYRVHRRVHDPIFYNRRSTSTTVFRFDASNDEYGVLYASPSFDACMAETIMRDRYQGVNVGEQHMIDESAITSRAVAVLGVETARPLRLADLTRPLWQYGFDARVLTVADYTAPNLWSRAIHDNHQQLDGIYFRSRYANEISVAVFSDRARLAPRGASIPLRRHPGLEGFLDRFQIGIADPGGVNWRAGES
ncbi:RES domain-containing protein [Paraburkholderia kirstenboschensis]|uniref:RES domain-containing protein n=1 Tax=Paraburkholderia kirstenboschensis TaxID=1245436 RepID=A0ABZ0EA83_9BURK|nr:RES domain-containing protein [Paraburkholderia kirstenboschensis]WOD14155.1 RES domain-containing protein [Paraburkholderia kirstenboschensis]